MDDDGATCGICGVDPVEHEAVEIGLTLVNMCEECYQYFKELEAERLKDKTDGRR